MIKKYLNKKGFTLVELLIVVSIIGVLTTLLMANFIGVRQRARDAQRKSDLRQIQSALELYRADQGSYPTTSSLSGPNSVGNCDSGTSIKSPNNCSVSTYMTTVPKDPMGSLYFNSGNYYFSGDGTTYTLGACLENASDSQGTLSSPSGNDDYCSSKVYYVLNNP